MTKRQVGYHWHLRRLMAERGIFATTELVPLLADRGRELVPGAGLPAGGQGPGAAQPDRAGSVVRHPGLLTRRAGRALLRGTGHCQGQLGGLGAASPSPARTRHTGTTQVGPR